MSAPVAGGTRLDAALAAARAMLAAAGVEEAALDARLLAQAATGLGHADLIARPETALDAAQAARLSAFLARRAAGEPVTRILGRRAFWSFELEVTPDVLDPRADTETLIEAALDLMGSRRDERLRIVDFGVGSGAILAALLTEFPRAAGVGVDLSDKAAAVAARNLARLGLGDRAQIVVGGWDAPLTGRFDLVASNPPYIVSSEIAGLAREVANHDPRLALDGGADGLDAYRALARRAAALIAPGGFVLFEVGRGQAPTVTDLLAAAGLATGPARRDVAGIERVVCGFPAISTALSADGSNLLGAGRKTD
ncbi:MAG: peptide chain release factor N(5)-glutamine methyltransferase [Rhizobiales bacterium]|nr:peptide chain release factor N(5)-glutamine methyltransferase [Hyphomicrobiales bacterium]